MATKSIFNRVEDVVEKLGDKSVAEPHVVQVNKGSDDKPRWMDVIEWHEACRILDEVFGPFGWSAEIVGSNYYTETGVYTVDMTLTGRAITEGGEVIELKRPGRGVGYVPQSARNSSSEHERQGHGAKSDAITNATKALGDGFGLYLYQKGASKSNGGQRSGGNNSGSNGVKWEDAPALEDVKEDTSDKQHRGLTKAQLNAAKRYGADLSKLTRGDVKRALETKGASLKAAATAARTGTPDDYADDDGDYEDTF